MYVYIFPKWTIFAQYKLGCWWHFHSQNSQKNSPNVLLLSKVFGIFFPWNVIPTPIQLLYNNSFDSCCLESAWKKTRKVELKKLTAKSFKNFCYCCFYFRIGKIRKAILVEHVQRFSKAQVLGSNQSNTKGPIEDWYQDK